MWPFMDLVVAVDKYEWWDQDAQDVVMEVLSKRWKWMSYLNGPIKLTSDYQKTVKFFSSWASIGKFEILYLVTNEKKK